MLSLRHNPSASLQVRCCMWRCLGRGGVIDVARGHPLQRTQDAQENCPRTYKGYAFVYPAGTSSHLTRIGHLRMLVFVCKTTWTWWWSRGFERKWPCSACESVMTRWSIPFLLAHGGKCKDRPNCFSVRHCGSGFKHQICNGLFLKNSIRYK